MTCPVWAVFRVSPKPQRAWATVLVQARGGPQRVRVLSAGPVWWSVLHGEPGDLQAGVWHSEQVDIGSLELLGVGLRVEIDGAWHDLPFIDDSAWPIRARRWVHRAHEVGGRVDGLSDP